MVWATFLLSAANDILVLGRIGEAHEEVSTIDDRATESVKHVPLAGQDVAVRRNQYSLSANGPGSEIVRKHDRCSSATVDEVESECAVRSDHFNRWNEPKCA